MRRRLLALVAVGIWLAVSAAPAFADHIGPHAHFIVTPNGDQVRVGPNACEMGPGVWLDNFHAEVHVGTPNSPTAFDRPNNPVNLIGGGC